VENWARGFPVEAGSWHEILMCNLYSIRTSRASLARKFHLSDNRMVMIDALPAIFPGHMAPIIKQTDDGSRELVFRSWGFILVMRQSA
jgi:putative SOS response-associated peptidase YedK